MTKSVGIMQPYFFPYIGYFQLIMCVDEFVVYDDVNFIKGGWINRNNFLIHGEKKLLTIQVSKASSNLLINQVYIKDDFQAFLKTMQYNYKKAPFFNEIMTLVESIVNFPEKNLALYLINSLQKICAFLSITTKISVSSSINKNNSLKSKDKVIEICKLLGASQYVNAIGGKLIYNKEDFLRSDIEILFINSLLTEYSQFKNQFTPALSIIDVLMFNSIPQVTKMLQSYILE